MSTIEHMLEMLRDIAADTGANGSATPAPCSPSTRVGEIVAYDFAVAFEFLLAVDDAYGLEFRTEDVYGKQLEDFASLECDGHFDLIDRWSLQQLADFIDQRPDGAG